MTLLFFAALATVVYLLHRNYQLEKRWRCMRYCWQSMSDFAGERLRDDGQIDEHWRDVVNEQTTLMARFGVKPLTTADIRLYEGARAEREIPILTEHRGLF